MANRELTARQYLACNRANCGSNLRIKKFSILSLVVAGPFLAAMGIIYMFLYFGGGGGDAGDAGGEDDGGGDGGGGGGGGDKAAEEGKYLPEILPPASIPEDEKQPVYSGTQGCSEFQLAAVVEKIFVDSDEYKFLCTALNLGDNLAVVLPQCFESREPSANVHFLKSGSPIWPKSDLTHVFVKSLTLNEGGQDIIVLVMNPPLPTPCASKSFIVESKYKASIPHYLMGWNASSLEGMKPYEVLPFKEKCVKNMESAAIFRKNGFFSGFQKVYCDTDTPPEQIVILFAKFLERLANAVHSINLYPSLEKPKPSDEEHVTGSGYGGEESKSEIAYKAMDNGTQIKKSKGKGRHKSIHGPEDFTPAPKKPLHMSENQTKMHKGKHRHGHKKNKIHKILPITKTYIDNANTIVISTPGIQQRKKHHRNRHNKGKNVNKKMRKQLETLTTTISIAVTTEEDYEEATLQHRHHKYKHTRRSYKKNPSKKHVRTSKMPFIEYSEDAELVSEDTPIPIVTLKSKKNSKIVTYPAIKRKIIELVTQEYTSRKVSSEHAQTRMLPTTARVNLSNVTVNKIFTKKMIPVLKKTNSIMKKMKTTTQNLLNRTCYSTYGEFKNTTMQSYKTAPKGEQDIKDLDKAIQALMGVTESKERNRVFLRHQLRDYFISTMTTAEEDYSKLMQPLRYREVTTCGPVRPVDDDEFVFDNYLLNQPLYMNAEKNNSFTKTNTIQSFVQTYSTIYSTNFPTTKDVLNQPLINFLRTGTTTKPDNRSIIFNKKGINLKKTNKNKPKAIDSQRSN